MSTLVHKRVELARKKENLAVVCTLPSGFLVLGDIQFPPGYCLLLPDPVVDSLNDLPLEVRNQFLLDMSIIGDALLEVTDAIRINYEILGKSDAALHAHIFPRYQWEKEEFKSRPVWFYDRSSSPRFSTQVHGDLLVKLRESVEKRLLQE